MLVFTRIVTLVQVKLFEMIGVYLCLLELLHSYK